MKAHLGPRLVSEDVKRGQATVLIGIFSLTQRQTFSVSYPPSVSNVIVGFDQTCIEKEGNIIRLCQTLQVSREQC